MDKIITFKKREIKIINMVSNQVVILFGIIFTWILTWLFVHNYQQKEDQIKKREKILEPLVIAFNKLDELMDGMYFDLFENGPKKIEPLRIEMNYQFKLSSSLVQLYFIKSEELNIWLKLDKELDDLLINTLPKYKTGTVKLERKEFEKDYQKIMLYLPKFIKLLKDAKFFKKIIFF